MPLSYVNSFDRSAPSLFRILGEVTMSRQDLTHFLTIASTLALAFTAILILFTM